MDTRLFDHFLDVAKLGSFAAVARKHTIDPSIISRAISQLEKDLGVRLFQRTTRSLALTEAGQRFKLGIEGVVDELDHIRETLGTLASEPEGPLTITASVAFGQTMIMPLLQRFLATYPKIDLCLKLTDQNVDMVGEGIDLAIRLAPPLEIDVIASKLMTTHYAVCASPDFLEGLTHRLDSIHDLTALDTVCFDIPNFRERWVFQNDEGIQTKVRVTPRVTISNALGVKEATLKGLGAALLPNWLIKQNLEAGDLIRLFPDYQVTATVFDTAAWLIYPSRSFLPRKTRLAIRFLQQTLGQKG